MQFPDLTQLPQRLTGSAIAFLFTYPIEGEIANFIGWLAYQGHEPTVIRQGLIEVFQAAIDIKVIIEVTPFLFWCYDQAEKDRQAAVMDKACQEWFAGFEEGMKDDFPF